MALLLLAGCGASVIATGAAKAACTKDADCGAADYCEITLSYCAEGGAVATGTGVCHRSCLGNACACTSNDDCPGSTCSQGRCGNIGFKCPAQQCPAGCPQTHLAEAPCSLCLCDACPSPDAGASDGGEPDAGNSDAGPADAGSDGGVGDAGSCAPNGLSCAKSSDCCSQSCILDTVDQGAHCYPMPDGGAIDGGAADAGGVPCGDAGTCNGDQLCFAVTGCGGVILADAGGVGGCRPTTYSCQSAGACAETPTCDCFRGAGDPCAGSQACSIDGGTVSCQFDYP